MRQVCIVLVLAVSATTNSGANNCVGLPDPIPVEAVCGQTLVFRGCDAPCDDADVIAAITPRLRLKLVDPETGVVFYETTSDAQGRFTFQSVLPGNYDLLSMDPMRPFYWPIKVTQSRRVCKTNLYLFMGLPASSDCPGHATLTRPASFQR